jgi:type IV pilus assembly protein PilC
MLFSRQLPLSNLSDLCRALRHNLAAGLTLRDVFRQMTERGPVALRPIAARIRTDLEGGDSLQGALEKHPGVFPPIFLSLAGVGEETGHLPEVFAELEKYFNLQLKLRRTFLAQIAWPVLEFVAAVFVIAGAIFILGIVNPSGVDITGKKGGFDPFGLGLMGASGAITFLTFVFGFIAALVGAYVVLRTMLKQKSLVDGFLLRVPVLGPCLHALAMARFCLALRLTLGTGLSIKRALRLCLWATSNEAFIARTPVVVEAVRSGDDLTTALTKSNLFSTEFLHILATAEEGGRVPEMMAHQADHYEEEAARRMTALTWTASIGVWLIVATFIIFAIFRVVLWYLNQLDSVLKGI